MSPTRFPFAAALFDLDGVVIDTTALHLRVWDTFARARGKTPTDGELLATNGRRADATLRAWFGKDLGEERIAALALERETLFHDLLATEDVTAVPGAVEYVERLRHSGVLLAVATSAVPMNAELALARVGLREGFDAVLTAADVTQGKPHPEVYLRAAAALGVSPRRCVVFEDSVSGVRAAKAAGAKCLALTTTFPREVLLAEGPEWLVDDFRALPEPLAI